MYIMDPSLTTSPPVNNATTVFDDSGESAMKDFTSRTATDELVVKQQSIIDFMRKPVLVYQTTWSVTAPVNVALYSANVGSLMLANAIWANKISGYAFVRGTVVFRVQINANPFQQGRLLLHFLPCAEFYASSFGDPSYAAMHNTLLASKTMQPCVELDCRDTSAILKMPYCTPYHWFNIKTGDADWGTFFVTPMAALQTGETGDTTIDVSVWMSFEDFELAGPTLPQAGGGKATKRYAIKRMNAEESKMEGGPISAGLSSISKAAGSFAEVPMLSAVAQPIEWVSHAAAGLASAFGWSKPETEQGGNVMIPQYNRYAATSDGLDPSIPLGLCSTNRTAVSDAISIRSEDEMSFSWLKRQPCLTTTLTWNDSGLTNTDIYACNVGPNAASLGGYNPPCFAYGTVVHGTHTLNYNVGPPIYYLSQRFGLWRGSICFTFKLVKTEMHTGRLQVSFTPGDQYTALVAPGTTNGAYSLREIIDISTGNEFCIHVPWLLPLNYLPTSNGANCSMGTLKVTILNQLRRPDNCANNINILMYVQGGEDFELAMPGSGTTLSGATLYNTVSPQGGFGDDMGGQCDAIADTTVGGADIQRASLEHMIESTGECFSSIKQLLNRNSSWYFSATPPSITPGMALAIYPWFLTVPYQTTGAAMTANDPGGDIFQWIAPMYMHFRGSARIGIAQTQQGNTVANSSVYGTQYPGGASSFNYNVGASQYAGAPVPAATTSTGPTTVAWYNPAVPYAANGIAFQSVGNGCTWFKVPYYSCTRCSFVTPVTTGGARANYTIARNLLVVQSYNGLTDYSLFRSFSDDFQLAYYIGCPPVISSYT